MTTSECHLEKCPVCSSEMEVVEGWDDQNGNVRTESCLNSECDHEEYDFDGDLEES